MKQQTKIAFFLLVLSPTIGELLSGSMPPLEFLNPLRFFLVVCLYGCSTVLIREARVRWGLQWSVILLAIAYGILEEGTIVKSFFNPNWVDMGKLSAYGMFGGVQWVWSLMLTFYHATFSTLIPIAIVDSLWPEYQNQPLLDKKGIRRCFYGLGFITVFGAYCFGTLVDGKTIPYYPHTGIWIGSLLLVLTLVGLAKQLPGRIEITAPLLPPALLVFFAFLAQATNLILPQILVDNQVSGATTISTQICFLAVVTVLAFSQIFNTRCTQAHTSALVLGSVLALSLLAPINEYINGAFGMASVGIAGLLLTLRWRNKTCIQPT